MPRNPNAGGDATMTLSEKPTDHPAEITKITEITKPDKNPTKLLDKALEHARKYVNMPMAAARQRIMEETPCGKSTAYKAYMKATREKTKKEAKPEPAGINIIEEKDKTPEFLEQAKAPSEIETIEEPTPQVTEDQQEQLDLFRDMLRGFYTMAFSKDGLLGEKYGRPPKQCEQLADQQFRWLARRYSIDDMQRYDTIILVAAYGTFFGGVAKDYMAEHRRKQPEKRAA